MYLKNSFCQKKFVLVTLTSAFLGILAFIVARILVAGISLFSNLFYLQKFSLHELRLSTVPQTWWTVLIPIVGGLLVGVMARYGCAAIRGHGIPEAMEKILYNESLIPRRMIILKPLATALAIGTGGPFGAEGPIIATGGSLGSFLGRFPSFGARERKILLSAGAAAGMTAIFGTPLSAVLISIELLLFEFSASTFVPVVVAVCMAQVLRLSFGMKEPVFMMDISQSEFGLNLLFYLLVGAISGGVSCLISKAVYWLEDLYEELPIHWMWWPAIGGLFVGVIGWIDPRSLGVGYENITGALQGKMLLVSALMLFVWKFLSWVISLGSGTAGGTLAPMLTFGSSLGLVLGLVGHTLFPYASIRPEICALVGMSAMFAGATRAVLTSTIFCLEATGAKFGLVPLLLGNSASYFISILFMEETIMTTKLSRRGKHVPHEYFHVKLEEAIFEGVKSDESMKEGVLRE